MMKYLASMIASGVLATVLTMTDINVHRLQLFLLLFIVFHIIVLNEKD